MYVEKLYTNLEDINFNFKNLCMRDKNSMNSMNTRTLLQSFLILRMIENVRVSTLE